MERRMEGINMQWRGKVDFLHEGTMIDECVVSNIG